VDILVSPKSGEFRKNGTIRIFPGPIGVPIGFFTSKDIIRANTRNWKAKVPLNQAGAGENGMGGGVGSGRRSLGKQGN